MVSITPLDAGVPKSLEQHIRVISNAGVGGYFDYLFDIYWPTLKTFERQLKVSLRKLIQEDCNVLVERCAPGVIFRFSVEKSSCTLSAIRDSFGGVLPRTYNCGGRIV